jgi:hypothetical protein
VRPKTKWIRDARHLAEGRLIREAVITASAAPAMRVTPVRLPSASSTPGNQGRGQHDFPIMLPRAVQRPGAVRNRWGSPVNLDTEGPCASLSESTAPRARITLHQAA